MLFLFDNCSLDAARRELRRGADIVAVEPQVFDLLEFLIRNRDRVVTRDDLIEHVWNGRIVSESTLATRLNAVRRAVGDDGARQSLIKTIARKGVRFVGAVREQAETGASPAPAAGPGAARSQSISFCRTSDGVNLAIGTVGDGPLLLKTSNWLNHLEYDWQSPIYSPLFNRLARRFRLIRYDGRGNGLSDHDVADISFAGFVRDLETVIETIKPERFALMGVSQGAATAISYAVRHPDRVSHLVLIGAYAQGRNVRGGAADREKAKTILAMMRQGWGDQSSAFMRAFSSLYLPNGTSEQIKWFADMQRISTSGETAARLRSACDDIDVLELLPQVKVPTLVFHARQDNVVPFEQGRQIAAMIPHATMISLESENHALIPGEPAWDMLLTEMESFLAAPAP